MTAVSAASPGGLARLAHRVSQVSGWRLWLTNLAAGLASSFAFAPFHLAPILFITLPVLMLSALGVRLATDWSAAARFRRGFTAGWWFAFGFHLVGLHWIGNAFLVQAEVFAWLLPFAVTLMPAGLAVFWGLACGVAALVPPRLMAPSASLAVTLTVAEYLRGTILTGFPWNTLGYALTWPLTLMQGASLLGIYGLTGLLLAMALIPAWCVLRDVGASPARRWAIVAVGVVLPLTLLAAYGLARLAVPPATVEGVRLRIVQPSIDQRLKWLPAHHRAAFDQHKALSLRAPSGRIDNLDGITHVFWPEAAMPFRVLEAPSVLDEIGAIIPENTRLVAGLLRVEMARDGAALAPRLHVFNSAVSFDGDGRPREIYDKIHLVPFGEYLPFQATLESWGLEQLTRLRGGFSTGEWPRQMMRIDGLPPVEMLICYEAIFPHETARQNARPGLLVNLTNDGWFGTFSGPYQHAHQARVRAVEFAIPLVRASNNGVSGLVGPFGRMPGRLGLNAVGTLDADLPQAQGPTVYARLRAWMLAIVLLITAMIGFALRAHDG